MLRRTSLFFQRSVLQFFTAFLQCCHVGPDPDPYLFVFFILSSYRRSSVRFWRELMKIIAHKFILRTSLTKNQSLLQEVLKDLKPCCLGFESVYLEAKYGPDLGELKSSYKKGKNYKL